MAILRLRPMTALLVAGAMLMSSTGAAAATASLPASQQMNAWAALSALSGGAPAVAVAGSAATVAQPSGPDAGPPPPTPVPPVETEREGLGVSPLLLALGAIAIGAAAYFLLGHHHKHANSPA